MWVRARTASSKGTVLSDSGNNLIKQRKFVTGTRSIQCCSVAQWSECGQFHVARWRSRQRARTVSERSSVRVPTGSYAPPSPL